MLNLVNDLTQTPVYKWYVVQQSFKNGYQLYERDWMRAENMITILGSTIVINGKDLYDHLTSMRIFTLTVSKVII